MTKQLRYPCEAFALAMVLLGGGMKQAMIVGIGLIFAVVLQAVLRENVEKPAVPTGVLGALLGVAAIYGMLVLVDLTPGVKELAALLALVLLLTVSDERVTKVEDIDYNELLFQSSLAYAAYVLVSVIREYLGKNAIFGFEFAEFAGSSAAFAMTMLALVLTGLFLAIVNRILKVETNSKSVVWAGVAILLIQAPFVWDNVPEILGTIVGSAFGLVVYLSLRKRMALADTEKHIAGLPVDMVILGIIYMTFSFL